jgi:hypothetical protein
MKLNMMRNICGIKKASRCVAPAFRRCVATCHASLVRPVTTLWFLHRSNFNVEHDKTSSQNANIIFGLCQLMLSKQHYEVLSPH